MRFRAMFCVGAFLWFVPCGWAEQLSDIVDTYPESQLTDRAISAAELEKFLKSYPVILIEWNNLRSRLEAVLRANPLVTPDASQGTRFEAKWRLGQEALRNIPKTAITKLRTLGWTSSRDYVRVQFQVFSIWQHLKLSAMAEEMAAARAKAQTEMERLIKDPTTSANLKTIYQEQLATMRANVGGAKLALPKQIPPQSLPLVQSRFFAIDALLESGRDTHD